MPDRYACPRCHSIELVVVVEVWAKLIQDSDGNLQTDTDAPDNRDHNWDRNSVMECEACNHADISDEFRIADPPAERDLIPVLIPLVDEHTPF